MARRKQGPDDGYADTSGSPTSSSDEERKRKSPRKKTPPKKVNKNVAATKKKDGGKISKKKAQDKSAGSPRSSTRKPTNSPRKYRPNSKILVEIKHYQQTTDLLLLRAPFSRVVREITQDLGVRDIKYKASALAALQVAAEYYLIGLFEDSYLLTIHRNRVTLTDKDIMLARRIRGRGDEL